MADYFDETYKKCDLYDRECMACGECGVCDLNPEKTCDNCMKCVAKSDADYLAIEIDRIEGAKKDSN